MLLGFVTLQKFPGFKFNITNVTRCRHGGFGGQMHPILMAFQNFTTFVLLVADVTNGFRFGGRVHRVLVTDQHPNVSELLPTYVTL